MLGLLRRASELQCACHQPDVAVGEVEQLKEYYVNSIKQNKRVWNGGDNEWVSGTMAEVLIHNGPK